MHDQLSAVSIADTRACGNGSSSVHWQIILVSAHVPHKLAIDLLTTKRRREYLALFGSLILVLLESVVRIITLGLPQPVIRFFYNRSKNAFILLSSSRGEQARPKKKSISASIANAADFVDLCALYGYTAEEHVIQTGDGYLLGVHRLGWRKGEEGIRVNAGEASIMKKVVYLHHGLMMNSEVWVCLTEKERCLPFILVERGYDVWV